MNNLLNTDNSQEIRKKNRIAIGLSLAIFAIVSLATGITIFSLQQKSVQDNKLLAVHYTTPLNGVVLGIQINKNWQVKMASYPESEDSDQDNLNNQMEEILGTDPNRPDTDKDGKKDGYEMSVGDDPTGLGKIKTFLTIPKIKIEAPVIWSASSDETVIQKDLQNGVIHYPGTAMPGQSGNSFITGHSSDYSWTPGNYKKIFSTLNKLNAGDMINFEYNLHNNRRIAYHYKIISKEIVQPDDPRLFEQTDKKILTLVTCWPLNSYAKRLMLRGELVE